MILPALLLASLMGVVLGMLGGGGSILTVPILIYGLGMATKEAIATSLLVVGVTSLVAALQHARAGHVNWRIGLNFSLFAMLGAYGGGRLAAYLPGTVLLILFATLMVITAVAMLRSRRDQLQPAENRSRSAIAKIAVQGLLVGTVTGLVGAGGGFLIVPALVLLGGMNMRQAVGTSLFVIALNSFAGLGGHLAHIVIDFELAAVISVAAIAGSCLGAYFARRLEPSALRRGFAYFVLAMAGFILVSEAPPEVYQTVFVDRWPFWAGGVAIGGFVIAFLLGAGRRLGVSTGYQDVCAAPFDPAARRSWRLPFIAAIIVGGLLSAALAGTLSPTTAMGMFDALWGSSFAVKAAIFTGGGILIGFGARLAGGCTSGHGIVGMAQLAPASIISTLAFMGAGVLVTNLVFWALGG